MFKKVLVIVSVVLALTVVGTAVPVLAADPAGAPPPGTQSVGRCGRALLLARLLLIQDEAKVDVVLAKAVENGKLTLEQAAKLKEFWVNHHGQFTKRVAFGRLMRIQDEAKLKDILGRMVETGKISQEQADKVIAAWEARHNK